VSVAAASTNIACGFTRSAAHGLISPVSVRFEHQRFVNRARRRWALWRAVEAAGVGGGAGAGAALLLVPVLLWRGQPGLSFAAVLIGLGAAAGLLAGLLRRPTHLQTALQLDRQLGWHELLSTAMSCDARTDAAFGDAVIALADARCREHSPAELIVRRLGGRAWGSIGILAALVITLAMIWSAPQASVARQAAGPGPNVMPSHSDDRPSPPIERGSPPPIRVTSRTAAGEASAARQQDTANDDSPNERSSATRSPRASDSNWPVAAADDRHDAAGTRAGRSSDGQSQALRLADWNPSVAGSDDAVESSGMGATEAGNRTTINPDARRGTSGRSGHESGAARVAPWQSASWSADCAAAIEALRSGRVPDAYRDLVRAYFDFREASEAGGQGTADRAQTAR